MSRVLQVFQRWLIIYMYFTQKNVIHSIFFSKSVVFIHFFQKKVWFIMNLYYYYYNNNNNIINDIGSIESRSHGLWVVPNLYRNSNYIVLI